MNVYYGYNFDHYSTNELYHYGVPGMKWGVHKALASNYGVNARYYSKRAAKSIDKAGRARAMANANRRAAGNSRSPIAAANRLNAKYYSNRANKMQARADRQTVMAKLNQAAQAGQNQKANKALAIKNSPEHQAKVVKVKKAAKIGAAVAGTALAAYGAYKVGKASQTKQYVRGLEAVKRLERSRSERNAAKLYNAQSEYIERMMRERMRGK